MASDNPSSSETVPQRQAYLVRLWRSDGGGTWRASAQDVVSGEWHFFDGVEQLNAFLQHRTGAQP